MWILPIARILSLYQRLRRGPGSAPNNTLAAGALLLAGGLLSGCGLQKDVDVELPAYPPQLVVECYLEDNRQPQALISESVAYLSAPTPSVPTDVTVRLIGPTGRVDTLYFGPGQNNGSKKFYTHRGRRRLTIRPGETYQIEVADTKGRRVTGSATRPATVPIDTVEWKFNDQTGAARRAYVLTKFRDPAGTLDYYRFQVHRSNVGTDPEVEYYPEDRLLDGTQVTLGTGYEFKEQDTLFVSLYHLDPPYYQFLRSINDAQSANGNPFGQPAAVQSTVQGGLGVFAILSLQRKRIIIR